MSFDSDEHRGNRMSKILSGNVLVALAASAKSYQSVVISSPGIKNGSTYEVYSGGRSSGTDTDGLYSDGTYTPGTQVASYTVSSIVTGTGGGMGAMRGGMRPGRP
jgi:hypothetical protein